jgi:hypothetical protein
VSDEKEPSHALPLRFYRDPLEVLIAGESATCKGCEHLQTILGTTYCAKGRRHGRRCKHYAERPGLASAT